MTQDEFDEAKMWERAAWLRSQADKTLRSHDVCNMSFNFRQKDRSQELVFRLCNMPGTTIISYYYNREIQANSQRYHQLHTITSLLVLACLGWPEGCEWLEEINDYYTAAAMLAGNCFAVQNASCVPDYKRDG